MSDFEARLRETLRGTLDPVSADPSRGPAAVRRARRSRAVRGLASGLACAVLAATAALALTRPDDDRRPPAGEPKQVATFRLDFGDSGDGTLTIDVPKAQACIVVSRNLANRSARELRRHDGSGEVVIEYLPASRRPTCEPLDPSDAAFILAKPARHSVVLGGGGPSVRSPLEPLNVVPPLLPDSVEIVCSQDGAVVLTPRVQPRRDGVRFRIHNQEGAWRWVNFTTPQGGDWGGRLRRRQVLDNLGNIPPGSHLVGCFRDDDSMPYSDPTDPAYATFTVVDHRDLWNDPELECVVGDQRREIPTDERVEDSRVLPDYDALIRAYVPGVQPDDVLERPTYPESESKGEPRTLIREGEKIASFVLTLDRVPGSRREYVWSILPVVCPDSGIAGG